MTKYTITVTRDHMARGKPGNCYECAVALAIRETNKFRGRIAELDVPSAT